MTTSPIRLLIAEDHEVVADALSTMFAMSDEFTVIGQTGDGDDVVDLAVEHQPDVVLMDISLRGLDGIEATRQLVRRAPEVRVLMLTMHEDAESVDRSIAAGAAGFLPKNAKSDDLFEAVRRVASGDGYLHEDIAGRFMKRAAPLIDASLEADRLTERELDVLRELSNGLSTKQIATQLTVSEETVKTHLRHIYQKLGVTDRTSAVAVALRKGMVR